MRFGIFTDTHYSAVKEIGTRRPSRSIDKFRIMIEELRKNRVPNLICLGDIINTTAGDKEENIINYIAFADIIAQNNMTMFLVLGNHDMEAMTNQEFSSLSPNIKIAPFVYESNDRMLVFLDANYNIDGSAYSVGANDWKVSYVPPLQIDMLENALSNTDKEAVIFIHQNLDDRPGDPHIVKNAAQVRKVLEHSGKVRQVYQGHYHRGCHNIQNGIEYITLKAMCELDDIPYMIVDL
jgi:predicted phosphodiesterase